MDFPEEWSSENGLPPEETRIQEIKVEPWPDGKRVRVHIQVTPFTKRPNIDITIVNSLKEEVANVSLIENLTSRFVITMHLRHPDPQGDYTVLARLFYPDLEAAQESSFSFHVIPPQIFPEG